VAESITDRIDRILTEDPFGLSAAAKLFGSFRQGRPTSPATVFRWCTVGVRLPDGRRVFLEHIRLGSRLLTSRPACIRFLAAQQSDPADPAPAPRPRSEARRKRASEAAGKKLAKSKW
jgi:hypothetical protein